MRIKPTTLTFQRFLAPIHVRSCLLEADLALLFLVFILATFVAECEILRQRIVAICQVYAVLYIFFVVEFIGTTILTLETVFTFPRFGNMSDFGL